MLYVVPCEEWMVMKKRGGARSIQCNFKNSCKKSSNQSDVGFEINYDDLNSTNQKSIKMLRFFVMRNSANQMSNKMAPIFHGEIPDPQSRRIPERSHDFQNFPSLQPEP